jgi:hypothetical protein
MQLAVDEEMEKFLWMVDSQRRVEIDRNELDIC